MIGIYKITNPIGEVYVGQSKDIESRFKAHKKMTAGTNGKLKKSFLKYGIDSHSFEIIEECLIEDLNIRECYWQESLNSIEEGLNTIPTKSIPRRERRLSYGEETVLVSIRIPESKKDEILDKFYALLRQYYVGGVMNPSVPSWKEKLESMNSEKKSNPTDDGIDVPAINFETIASLPFGTQLVDAFGTKGAIRKDANDNYYTKRTHNGKLEILKHENYACAMVYANENFK